MRVYAITRVVVREYLLFLIIIKSIQNSMELINSNNLSNTIKFIPLGNTGPEQIFSK